MINTALSSRCCGPNSRFFFFFVDPQWSTSTASCSSTSTASCSTTSFCTGPCTPPSLTRSGTRRGWSAPSFWTRSSSTCGSRVCSRGHQASLMTATTQDTLFKTHSLIGICVVGLSSIASRSVAAAAARSLMRFSPSPSCRGDEANHWLESAFITHFGCVSRHLFARFPQFFVIACVSSWFQQSLVIACVSVFFCVRHSTRTQFFCTHQRPRITESAVLKHIHHKDRRQLQLSRRRWLHDCTASCERCSRSRSLFAVQDTHLSSRSLFARHWPVSALPPAKRRARLNTCRSRPVSARCTRCRCYNVFVLVLHSHHKSIGGRLLLLPQAARDGLALCHLSRQDTSRGVPSQGRQRSKVCACRRYQEPRLTAGTMGRQRVKEDPWSRG